MYPEHDKLADISTKSQSIGEFLDWLQDGEKHPGGIHIQLAVYFCDRLVPHNESIQQLLSRFFNIDLDKLEEEKREMLEECRKMSKKGK